VSLIVTPRIQEQQPIIKYIEANREQIFEVNLKYPNKVIQEAKKCNAYFSLIENGLLIFSSANKQQGNSADCSEKITLAVCWHLIG